MSIFDLVVATEIVAYWDLLTQDRAPYPCEPLFPAKQKLGLKLDWLKGSKGTPKILKLSAFDAKSVPRGRIGFDKLSAQMPFFKESKYIDEELRQQLNMVIETGKQAIIDTIIANIFDDEISLLEGASAQRELMRMQALTTGIVSIASNGQSYAYDYEIPSTHKITVGTSWSNVASDIMKDIREAQLKVLADTGVKPTRAMCDNQTWNYILNNTAIKKSIYVLSEGQAYVSTQRLQAYLLQELELEVYVNDKRYTDAEDVQRAFMPADTFVLFPTGTLGETAMGTTPEESDLQNISTVANVSITDTGVAVTTVTSTDPVNVETKVTMICLPSFPMANHVAILDVAV